MTQREFHKALDLLTPGPDAQHRMATAVKARRRPGPLLIRPALAAAAVLLVMCTVGTALAASPELRQAVLSFFRLEEPEQIPHQPPGQTGVPNGPDIAQGIIGGQVRAQYIRLDKNYQLKCGLFSEIEWDEANTAIQSAEFWEIRGDTLVETEVELRSTNLDVTWRGVDYQGTLYWFVRNGRLGLYAGATRSMDSEVEANWYVSDIPGRTDVVLLRLSQGRQLDYGEYGFLWHLDTGEVEDFLAGTGAEDLELAYDYACSEDLQQVLVQCRTGLDSSRVYLCDRTTGTATALDTLVDFEVQAASFGKGDTLILYSLDWDDDIDCQTVACYAYDIPSGQWIRTLAQAPFCRGWEEQPSGVMTFGNRCVRIAQDGQTWVVDLNTGAETLVDNFTFTQGSSFMLSPNGKRLLYLHTTTPETGGLGISQLGVMDLEQGTFLAFDREGFEELYEEGVGWCDDNRVTVRAHTRDEAAPYLLVYEF